MSSLETTWRINRIARSELVSAVFFIGFMNGVSEIVFRSVQLMGVWGAISATFGLSVFIYACAYLVLRNLMSDGGEPASGSDKGFCAVLLLLCALPHPAISWVALTALGLREYRASAAGSFRRRASVLMLGLTVPMFWSRLFFSLLSSWILKADAILVSLVVHTPHFGNVVMLPHGGGFLFIASPCSSLANMSLAMLCWLMFVEYSGRRRSRRDLLVCALACASVVAINVARISYIAFRPDLYDIIHGSIGATIVTYFSTFLLLFICSVGVRREVVVVDKDHRSVDTRAVICRT